MKKIQCYLLLIIFFVDCTQEKNLVNDGVIPVVANMGNFKVLNLSDYATSIEYIPLETNDSILIGEIGQIGYEKGNIVVLSNDVDLYSCLVFNKNGTHRCGLGHRGEGPNDYYLVHSFDINPVDQTILMKAHYRKYFVYSMDGELIKRVLYPNCPANYQTMRTMSLSIDTFFSDLVSYSGIDYKGLVFTHSTDSSQVIKTYPDNVSAKKKSSGFSLRFEVSRMWRCGINAFYFRPLNDTIFTINNNLDLEKAYVFDLGKYKVTPEWCFAEPKDESIDFILPESFNESSKYLYMDFYLGKHAPEPFEYIKKFPGHEVKMTNSNVRCLYSKKTGELQFMLQPEKKKSGFKNDLDDGPVAIWPDYVSFDDELVTHCSAEEFLEHYESLENPSEKIKQIAQNLKPDDNPVVIIVSLKK